MSNHPARYGRRRFLGQAGFTLGGLAVGPAVFAACGDDDEDTAITTTTRGGGAKELYVANWTAYIDEETVGIFERETGIKTKYTEEITDNNILFAEIQPLLSQGRTIDPDIIVPSSWMAARLIELGWADKLPLDDIPNLTNLRPDLANPGWDPTGEYTLPWQSGITGIAYNRKSAGRELRSVDDLLDPAFRGRVAMLSEMRDTVGLLMLSTGADPSNPTFEAAAPAFEKLEKAVQADQIDDFAGNEYLGPLGSGDYVACIAWSGDVAQLAVENPDVKFFIPEEGGMKWVDTMLMPKGTVNVDSVAAWMDHVYDPANAARITAYVQYISCVAGVGDELRKLGGEAAALADNPQLFPDAELLTQVHEFGAMSEEEEGKFDEEFSRISGV